MTPYLTPGTTVRAGTTGHAGARVPHPRVRYERMNPCDRPGGETGGVCPACQWLRWASRGEIVPDGQGRLL